MAHTEGTDTVKDYYELLGLDAQLSAAELLDELDVLSATYANRAALGGAQAEEAREKYRLCAGAAAVFSSDASREEYDRKLQAQRVVAPESEAEAEAQGVDWMARTRSYYEAGDYAAARIASDKMRLERRDDPMAFILSAQILLTSLDESDLKHARRYADEALVLDIEGTHEWLIRTVRGQALEALGDLQAAWSEYARADEVAPISQRPHICYLMAKSQLANRQFAKAYQSALAGLERVQATLEQASSGNKQASESVAKGVMEQDQHGLVELAVQSWQYDHKIFAEQVGWIKFDTTPDVLLKAYRSWKDEVKGAYMPESARSSIMKHIDASIATCEKHEKLDNEVRGKASKLQAKLEKKTQLFQTESQLAEKMRNDAGMYSDYKRRVSNPSFPIGRLIAAIVAIAISGTIFPPSTSYGGVILLIVVVVMGAYFISGVRDFSRISDLAAKQDEVVRKKENVDSLAKEIDELKARIPEAVNKVDWQQGSFLSELRAIPVEFDTSPVSAPAASPTQSPQPNVVIPAAAGGSTGRFDVVLTAYGTDKIGVIRVVRQLTSLDLKNAKGLVESVPCSVLHGVSSRAAEEARQYFAEQGFGDYVTIQASRD